MKNVKMAVTVQELVVRETVPPLVCIRRQMHQENRIVQTPLSHVFDTLSSHEYYTTFRPYAPKRNLSHRDAFTG